MTSAEYPLTMTSVCACVLPHFASPGLFGAFPPLGAESAAKRMINGKKFVGAIGDFEPGALALVLAERGPATERACHLLDGVSKLCESVVVSTGGEEDEEENTNTTSKFLSANVTQVFVWMTILPSQWLADVSVSATCSALDPWFEFCGVRPGSATYLGAVAAIRAMAPKLSQTPDRQSKCAAALCYLVRASNDIKRRRRLDIVVQSIGFSRMINPALRLGLVIGTLLLPHAHHHDLFPPWLMPPLSMTGAAAKLKEEASVPKTLIEAFVVHVFLRCGGGGGGGGTTTTRGGGGTPKKPQIGCIETFELVVFGGRGLVAFPVLVRQALVFALCPDWADEWKAAGWPTPTRVQRGLAKLHRTRWAFTKCDVVDLLMLFLT